MVSICRLLWFGLVGLFRSRGTLEAEILALRHQLTVLQRKVPTRPTFGNVDRFIFLLLYRVGANHFEHPHDCEARDSHSLASGRFPSLVALEVTVTWRSTANAD